MNRKSKIHEKYYRVGIDIGGTFTDIVLLSDDGKIFTKKVFRKNFKTFSPN